MTTTTKDSVNGNQELGSEPVASPRPAPIDGSRLRPTCVARRCFYDNAHECQNDQGWHTYIYRDGIQFTAPCDCECHSETLGVKK